MKLKEMKKEQKKYKIYLDIDGVFADFDKWVEESVGVKPNDEKFFWDHIGKYVEENPDAAIWGELDLLPDAMVLWDYVKDKNPTFLSSTGTSHEKRAIKEKHDWVEKHFPGSKVILVNKSRLKAKYADENSILIDDRMKSIGPWREANGIGILHTSAEKTIKELKKLGV